MSRIYIGLYLSVSFLMSCSRPGADTALNSKPVCSEQVLSSLEDLKAKASTGQNLISLKKSCLELQDLMAGEACQAQAIADSSRDLCGGVDAQLNSQPKDKVYPQVVPLGSAPLASQNQISDEPHPVKDQASPRAKAKNVKLDYFLLGLNLNFKDDKDVDELSRAQNQKSFQNGKIIWSRAIDSKSAFCTFNLKKSYQFTKNVHFSFVLPEKNHLALYTRDFALALNCSQPEVGEWTLKSLQEILGNNIQIEPIP